MIPINPDEFVVAVQPLLERKDLQGLLTLLQTRWTAEQIVALMHCGHVDARKVALLALALVGKPCCIDELAHHLKDPDPVVNQLAEHALWSIWFRIGTPKANYELARGAQALHRREFAQAMKHFHRALEADPLFAEAYNQRAIVNYLQEEYAQSIADCNRAVERMPCHFGAWAGLGHCHAHLGDTEQAIKNYEQALSINPHLSCVRQAVEHLRQGS